MRVKHHIQVECRCPADKLPDLYEVVIEAERVIPVEQIIALADTAKGKTMYQEDLCLLWARALSARVTMTGWHYGRVRTVVEA